MTATTAPSSKASGERDLTSYGSVIRARKWTVLAVAAVVTGVALLLAMNLMRGLTTARLAGSAR